MLPLRKGNQGTTEMTVPFLFFCYISEIQAQEKWQIRDLFLLFWDVTEHIFSREWLPSTVYQVLLGRILLHPSCWCYMQLLHQIIPLLHLIIPRREGVWETAGRWDTCVSEPSIVNILSIIPSSKLSAGQIKQSPHFTAALCLGENPGSSASYSSCPPMSQICAVNPGPGIEGSKRTSACFVPAISWLKHSFLLMYTHTHTHMY